jgi:hypothetical protein
MAIGYSKVIEFEVTSGVPVAVELPAPPRGVLDRVILTQVSGEASSATCNIYDRKGACIAATDLNVESSGVVTSVEDQSGFLLVTTEAAHNLLPGAAIELKNCDESSYNAVQEVVSILSETEFVTDQAYVSSEITGPLWQTAPFNLTTAPVTHLMYTFSKSDDADYVDFDIDQAYENKDNQSVTMRSRYSALWLEVLTEGEQEAPLKFQIAYTCRGDVVI